MKKDSTKVKIEKGITLIALIVTIVIVVILVEITIVILIKYKLLDKIVKIISPHILYVSNIY